VRFPYIVINPVSLKTISELKVRHAAASVGFEVFGSDMSFGFCALAGRQGEGRKRRIAEQLSELRNKKQRACTKNLVQTLDLFGARSRNRTGTSLRTGDFKSLCSFIFSRQSAGIGEKTLSDFSSDIVTRYPAALGVVAASAG